VYFFYPFSTTVCSRAFKGSTSKAASAIKAAIEAGELAQERRNSYISLKSEANTPMTRLAIYGRDNNGARK